METLRTGNCGQVYLVSAFRETSTIINTYTHSIDTHAIIPPLPPTITKGLPANAMIKYRVEDLVYRSYYIL